MRRQRGQIENCNKDHNPGESRGFLCTLLHKNMIFQVEKLDSPPVIGQIYNVPCVMGTFYNIGPHRIPARLWPVMRPSHEDSKYLPKFRSTWKDVDGIWSQVDEVYYEADDRDLHFHVDPRFAPDEFYTDYEREHQDWHNIIRPEGEVIFQELVCLREMPTQRLFTGFGRRFVEDHKGKKLKCLRCPHRGINLASVPVVDGVITCPAHGLRYDSVSGICITE